MYCDRRATDGRSVARDGRNDRRVIQEDVMVGVDEIGQPHDGVGVLFVYSSVLVCVKTACRCVSGPGHCRTHICQPVHMSINMSIHVSRHMSIHIHSHVRSHVHTH